ncbi:MAG: peptidylprolyl isomerase [Candidatus Marinimicrobia bacterium]|nr:peptidylprolyl isomerase [Candidatus Neomarinimicrobiota bacterium]MBL7059787.1 peptidylprolyl isomerase [Candidatus Neomarinimicrobiota bacterium]
MKKWIFLIIGVMIMSCEKEIEVGVISTQFGDMIVEFYEESAPKHVESFKLHTQNGYFDSTTFHRVIPGFMIQGGDPNSKDDDRSNDGIGGNAAKYFGIGQEDHSETWMIPAEFSDSLSHLRGTLSMARSSDPNSAGSQFFICVGEPSWLDGQYTIFGKVIQGVDIIDRIVSVPRDRRDNPFEKVEMTVKIVPKSDVVKKVESQK